MAFTGHLLIGLIAFLHLSSAFPEVLKMVTRIAWSRTHELLEVLPLLLELRYCRRNPKEEGDPDEEQGKS
jgi:hypothetical protein